MMILVAGLKSPGNFVGLGYDSRAFKQTVMHLAVRIRVPIIAM